MDSYDVRIPDYDVDYEDIDVAPLSVLDVLQGAGSEAAGEGDGGLDVVCEVPPVPGSLMSVCALFGIKRLVRHLLFEQWYHYIILYIICRIILI